MQLHYAPAFVWDTTIGGRAFEYTILALRRRHLAFKSMHFAHTDASLTDWANEM